MLWQQNQTGCQPRTISANRDAVAGGEPSALTVTAEAGKKAASRSSPRKLPETPRRRFSPCPSAPPRPTIYQIKQPVRFHPGLSPTATGRTSLQLFPGPKASRRARKLRFFPLPKGSLHDLRGKETTFEPRNAAGPGSREPPRSYGQQAGRGSRSAAAPARCLTPPSHAKKKKKTTNKPTCSPGRAGAAAPAVLTAQRCSEGPARGMLRGCPR